MDATHSNTDVIGIPIRVTFLHDTDSAGEGIQCRAVIARRKRPENRESAICRARLAVDHLLALDSTHPSVRPRSL